MSSLSSFPAPLRSAINDFIHSVTNNLLAAVEHEGVKMPKRDLATAVRERIVNPKNKKNPVHTSKAASNVIASFMDKLTGEINHSLPKKYRILTDAVVKDLVIDELKRKSEVSLKEDLERIEHEIRDKVISYVNDGLSDSEIHTVVNRIRTKYGLNPVDISNIRSIVNSYLESSGEKEHDITITLHVFEGPYQSDESDVESDDDSDDSDYVDESDDDSDDSDYVDESDDDSDDSDSDSDDDSDDDETEVVELTRRSMVIHLDQKGVEISDKITITGAKSGGFIIRYDYDMKPESTKRRAYNDWHTADRMEVVGYIGTLLDFVAMDDNPYKQAEIDIPFFPSVTLTPETLRCACVRQRVGSAVADFLYEIEKKQ